MSFNQTDYLPDVLLVCFPHEFRAEVQALVGFNGVRFHDATVEVRDDPYRLFQKVHALSLFDPQNNIYVSPSQLVHFVC